MPATARVTILMDPAEKRALETRAKRENVSLGELIRRAALAPKQDEDAALRAAVDMLRKSNEEIANLFAPIVANNGVDESMERITKVVAMMKDRVNFVKELWPLCSFFFIAPTEYDEKTVKKRWKAD